MRIIGWIREGDKAACGGNVLEGDQHFIIRGRPISFEGARMACSKNCVIAEGVRRFTLSNGRSRVIHGMKTSGGCPMISTLNDVDGMHNEMGETVPLSFAIDQDGNWTGIACRADRQAIPDEEQRDRSAARKTKIRRSGR